MHFSQLHFKSKLIELTNNFIYKYDVKMIKSNEQESKMSPTEKWNFCKLVPLCNILSMSGCATLCHM